MGDNFWEISPGVYIGDGHPTYFIAEIGQNHQGDLSKAKQLIAAAKKSGANCVKFQKSNLNEKFTKSALDRPYTNTNSWGTTYREHKEYLEFNSQQYFELKQFAADQNISFTASAMDCNSVDFLCADLGVPFLKIGSGDSNNLPLIEKAAKKYIPLIISTGMINLETVQKIYSTVIKYHKKLVLMHCISSYPLPPDNINLKVLELYRNLFPDSIVGYSGHELGTDCCIAAVALGAKVIERHFTLDHNQIGSDHRCSLTPSTFRKMISRIRNIEVVLGQCRKEFQISELVCARKLAKSIVMACTRPKGHILSSIDLVIKVAEPPGIDGTKLEQLIGRKLNKVLKKDELVSLEDLQ